MTTARKIFEYIGIAILTIFLVYGVLELEKENKELEKDVNKTPKDVLDSLPEPNGKPKINKPHTEGFLDLFPNENNVLKVGDKFPSLSSGSGGGFKEKRVLSNEGFIHTVVFNKGRKASGIDGGITYIYTSPTGATVSLDTDRRITEIEGKIYKNRL